MLISRTVIFSSICLSLIRSKPLFLTPYIESNLLVEAKNISAVNGLPKAPTIESYSGFITVDKQYESHLFFWFFPSFNKPETAPVIIWLEGGPGSSSMWSIFSLNPLFHFNENQSLCVCPYAWAKNYSMLYIDNPVGTGFSFTKNQSGYSTDMNSVANNLYEFLQQFFTLFHEYRDNDLYIMGESYAGKYVPALGYKLMQMSNESKINFRGIAIGNPFIDPINQMNFANILKSLGLIDEKEMQIISRLKEELKTDIRNGNFADGYTKEGQLWYKIYYDMLKQTELTYPDYDVGQSVKGWQHHDRPDFEEYINAQGTRLALHVGSVEYDFYNYIVPDKLKLESLISSEKNLTALIDKYKVMIYVGNFDWYVGVDTINGMLENPDWKYYKEFYHAEKKAWKVHQDDEEITGFLKTFGNFTFAVVRNAGHYVAYDKPRALQNLINRFINNQLIDI